MTKYCCVTVLCGGAEDMESSKTHLGAIIVRDLSTKVRLLLPIHMVLTLADVGSCREVVVSAFWW
jgi:hypothetical protein